MTCSLIPLNKNPGLKTYWCWGGTSLNNWKGNNDILKKDVMHAAGLLQDCAGQEAGAKAAIHAMSDTYNDEH